MIHDTSPKQTEKRESADLTIPARLVAEGVGLPPVWKCRQWYYTGDVWAPDDRVDLSDPQTAFGVALRLDEEENASATKVWRGFCRRPDAAGQWAEAVGERVGCSDLTSVMIARLTHIGQDHAIRRALGWEVERGSLATLTRKEPDDKPWWCLTAPHDSGPYRPAPIPKKRRPAQLACLEYRAEPWSDAYLHVPGLAGVTSEVEALASIYAEVCGG